MLGVGRSAHTIPIPWTSPHLVGFGFFVGYEIEVILGWVLTRAVIYLWGGYNIIQANVIYLWGRETPNKVIEGMGYRADIQIRPQPTVRLTDVNIRSTNQTF